MSLLDAIFFSFEKRAIEVMVDESSVLFLKNRTVPRDLYEEVFTEYGFLTQFIPLLDHIHAESSFITSYLTSDEFIKETDALIITSQRAVEALSDAMEKISQEQRSRILSKKAFTVGPATQKVLEALGFTKLGGGDNAGNGAILSEIILKDLEPHQKVTFFTGETRRDIIPRKLLSKGYNLKEVVIYRTVEKPQIVERFTQAFNQLHPEWIIFFSPQGTQDIVEFLKVSPLRDAFKIASIGPTTETYLLDNGIKPNLVSEKPEASSLLMGIKSFSVESIQ